MAGLETMAAITNRIDLVLGSPPVRWTSPSAEEPAALVGFDSGVCWSVARQGGRVTAIVLAEAGMGLRVELDEDDARTAALLCGIEGT